MVQYKVLLMDRMYGIGKVMCAYVKFIWAISTRLLPTALNGKLLIWILFHVEISVHHFLLYIT